MRSFSLSSRLVGHLLLGQIAVYLLVWIVNIPLSLTGVRVDLDMIWNDLAENHARAQVASSLRRDAHGEAFIAATHQLAKVSAANPHFKYAVFDLDQRRALPGSSPDLVAVLARMDDIRATSMNFTLADARPAELRGAMTKEDTAIGRVIIATYGYEFHWSDLGYFIRDNARDNFIYFIPVAAAAAAIAWFAARRGLAPLRTAADHAASIDMNSIDQRIPLAGIPAETLPLVEAVNAALARLDAGAARQRRFAANAAHELRTPVAILRTRIDALPDLPQKTDLKRDTRRIQNIVEQLLIAARIGEIEALPEERLDLNLAVREIVADYAPLVIETQRQIDFESCAGAVPVAANRRALDSILANLIDNALRAEPAGGAVIVRVGHESSRGAGAAPFVDIIDHGEGVPVSERETIFEPFWRKNEASPGTGLGLAIVRELAENYGGRVEVSDTPGGGATFRVRFPPADARDWPPPTAADFVL